MKKKITIQDMKKIASLKNGRCISAEYINGKTKLEWQCEKGHIWSAIPENIKQGKWCPTCGIEKRAKKKRGNIQEMNEIAKSKNGKCLSKNYINNSSHLEWRCEKGHEWKATPSNIKRGKWCPKCAIEKNASKRKKTIEDMHELAKKNEGECLSDLYINMNKKLKWKCKKGHVWEALPNNISRGKWCPTCAGRNKKINDMIEYAKTKSGNCLSPEFTKMNDKLLWECEYGHRWEASANSILNTKSWCPECSGNIKKTIEEMGILARGRGGECVSKKYINIDTPLEWKCSEGHIFKQTPYYVRIGSWCPDCNKNFLFFNEEKCRFILESLLSEKFCKTKRELNRGLELDGYNKELSAAFEYNGVQHYFYNNYFHKNEKEFEDQQLRDNEKSNICKKKGIKLIVIPYTVISDEDKVEFIKNKLKENEILIKEKDVNWKEFYKKFDLLKELKNIVEIKGGKCLSNEYLGNDKKLKLQCEKGHLWESTPYNIKNGSWCTVCLGRNKTIDDMRKLANKKGGKCLSDTYINSQTKLIWECGHGHKWEAVPASISSGTWCPYCSKRIVTLYDVKEIAKKKNGECLSEEYMNSSTKMKWKCEKGHIWESSLNTISNGSWCPSCSGNKPLTIEEMNELANKKNGKVLSKKYINSHTKLKWQCEKRHIWQATPSDIKQGKWCPTCGREKAKEKRKKYSINYFKKIAVSRGGKCLSACYKNVDTKLEWICEDGHKWKSIPYLILNGSWCPECAVKKNSKKRKLTLEEMHEEARKKNGKCLSEEYINAQTKLKWECEEGHKWESTPNSIRNGTWCPNCAIKNNANKQRGTIRKMKELAEIKNGKCLSKEYINAHIKLEWECNEGHRWLAKPNNIQQGKWCPICARETKK